jgi:hypothetical protein
MIYPPKRDLWLLALLILICLLLFAGAFLLVGASFWKRVPGLWVPGIILGTVGTLLLWFLVGSFYEITESHLILGLGPLRWRLPLDTIAEVYSTSRFHHDFGWGLAFSLDRLRINCRDRLLPFWISPEDKAGFIAELVGARPDLKVTSD